MEVTDLVNKNVWWWIEDIQSKINEKLANIFSFYNEQEFLDEMHGCEFAEIDVVDGDVCE